ncbi:MAG TPA: hypothetical protein VHC22_10755 [Pirellulales bacterium]|nr:hypothetical protein [Pirellulales bacterium]
MYRTLCLVAMSTLLALPCRGEETVDAKETLIRLTVSPAAAPQPALKYTLLPEMRDMEPGNPVQGYMLGFMEQEKFFFDKQTVERRDQLLKMPLAELPKDEVKDYGGSALKQADWAARLDHADWQILLKLKAQGISLLIPDVQQLRVLARALKVRFRGDVADHRFDDAVRTAQTMFALSRHLGEHLTFIGNLVGGIVAHLAIDPLEEMIGQPGCPNLYWALTYLPSPLVRTDIGAQGERIWIGPMFRDLDDKAPLSEAQLKRVVAFFEKVVEGTKILGGKTLREWLDVQVKDNAVVAAARRRLADAGISPERLSSFPAEQVLLLDEKRACIERLDDVIKVVQLPASQVDAFSEQILAKGPILFDMAPSFEKVKRAQIRLDQRIALLRHVEALRLYAAEHGKLPAKLSDISVPLPEDPFSGQPFRYELNGKTAHLRGTAPKAEANNPTFNLHYELTLRN